MSGIPRTLVLSEEEMAAIADAAVSDLARRLADRALRPLHDPDPVTHATAEDADTVLVGEALARLHALVHLQRAVERQKDRAAETAVQDGAGYPQLGRACSMSRQGARRRWPGLVTGTSDPSRTTNSLTRTNIADPSAFPGSHPPAHAAPIDRSL